MATNRCDSVTLNEAKMGQMMNSKEMRSLHDKNFINTCCNDFKTRWNELDFWQLRTLSLDVVTCFFNDLRMFYSQLILSRSVAVSQIQTIRTYETKFSLYNFTLVSSRDLII